MTSPYSSSLLQQPAPDVQEQPTHSMPRPAAHTRSVTQVVAQPPMAPAPVYAPQAPVYAQPAPTYVTSTGGGGFAAGMSTLMLGILVVLVGAVAMLAAYWATEQASPTAAEAAVMTNLASQEGYLNGRARGIELGRTDGNAAASTAAQLRASIARQRAWDAAFKRGVTAGTNSYRAPRSYGYSGYSGPRYSSGGFGETFAALGQAQSIANATGAPVDVEIY